MRCGTSQYLLALAAVLGMVPAQAQISEVVLHSFEKLPLGGSPQSGVIRDPSGNLYGTTLDGGAGGYGLVYKLAAAGGETVLHNFTGGADGGNPYAGVVRDSAGNLYGTTYSGGAAGFGVVYKLDSTGHETVLYNFSGGADGANPYAGVTLDSAGNLYGTTYNGGAGFGIVYQLDSSGHETVRYAFMGGTDGSNPYAGVILDSAGNLYGTTYLGGSTKRGVVYKVDPTGHETVLYSFQRDPDAGGPYAGVVLDASGNLYGTTRAGGSAGRGAVYKLDSSGHETVLHSFSGTDGDNPYAAVILDAAGNLYGTTPTGGPTSQAFDGIVYKLDAAGQETVLYNFTGPTTGSRPIGGVILDAAGNLYGTTSQGGPANVGLVYKLDAAGHETILQSFTPGHTGANPYAGVIRDAAGNLYGTTYYGGTRNKGVVYKLDVSGKETVLHNFLDRPTDGAAPQGGLIMDAAGNLYGTTVFGGPSAWGTLYKVTPTGQETVLYNFSGNTDGGNPEVGLVADAAGNYYGTTWLFGVVYEWDTTGHFSVVGNAPGTPYAGVTVNPAGGLYGSTWSGGSSNSGTVYQFNASAQRAVLYNFSSYAQGELPYSAVTLDASGNLYGTASEGGPGGQGVVYKLDSTRHYSILYGFTGGADGGTPYSSVVLDSSGNLYGTTYYGGATNKTNCVSGCGVVYKVDPAGRETVLYTFAGGADGANPYAGLIFDAAGNLYGTTYNGGIGQGGVIYQIRGALSAP